MSKKKKILIIAVMVVLLVVTGYLNIMLNNKANNQTTTVNTSNADFFVNYREYRTDTRDAELLLLDAIINSTSSTQEEIQVAKEKKEAIQTNLGLEFALESKIMAKGYNEVVVACSTDMIDVMIRSASELEDAQVAQIVDIIEAETGKGIDYINIIPVD